MYTDQPNTAAIRDYLANPDALCNARLDEIAEGSGRGTRIIQVTNGTGLDFTVTPDRALDLVECRFRGIPVAFRTPVGYSHPARFEHEGIGWLRNWTGGLMTTAGLRNAGGPNGDFGLHGRISNQQAEQVGIERDGDTIVISGTVRESATFGENLQLKRTITTAWNCNSITVRDEITNLGAKTDYLQLLYHCNFGYPFVSPALRFTSPEHPVRPRDQHAAEGIAEWHLIPEPTPDFVEQCYFHDLPAEDGYRQFTAENPDLGIRLDMIFSADELPNFVQWKNPLSRMYVLGLEPGNVSLQGRTADIEQHRARAIQPDETVKTELTFAFTAI